MLQIELFFFKKKFRRIDIRYLTCFPIKIDQIISLDVDLTRHIPDFSEKVKDIDTIYLSNYKTIFQKLAKTVIAKTHFLKIGVYF